MIETPLTIYEDLYKQDRLSQSPAFLPGDTPEHVSFMAWVEAQKPYMSECTYWAYRAFFRSRFMAQVAPCEAVKDICLAYRKGVLNGQQSLRQMLQTFVPGLYRRCADFIACYYGYKLARSH
jgi:hypothetical protein